MKEIKLIFAEIGVNSLKMDEKEIKDYLDSLQVDPEYSEHVKKLIEELNKPKYELIAEVA